MFQTKKLTNFKIIARQDKKGQDYFIIFDNNEEGSGKNGYFCWLDGIQIGKEDLLLKRDNWKEIEIEYEEKEKGNRVINIWSDTNKKEILV